MRKWFMYTVAIAIATGSALPALGQSTAVVAKGPGVVGAVQRTKVVATVVGIDRATREVTLKGPQGKEMTVMAGPEVRNFAQINVADKVNVEYTEALTLELKKGSTEPRARSERNVLESAKPGDRPAGVVGRQVTVVAEVTALNAATQTVTLRGPERTVDLKVADPQQFKLIAKGDRVEATYTEAVAVAVEPAR